MISKPKYKIPRHHWINTYKGEELSHWVPFL